MKIVDTRDEESGRDGCVVSGEEDDRLFPIWQGHADSGWLVRLRKALTVAPSDWHEAQDPFTSRILLEEGLRDRFARLKSRASCSRKDLPDFGQIRLVDPFAGLPVCVVTRGQDLPCELLAHVVMDHPARTIRTDGTSRVECRANVRPQAGTDGLWKCRCDCGREGGRGRAPLSREGRDQSVIGKMVVEESKET